MCCNLVKWGEEVMVKAKIYQPAKTAMQSGRGKTKGWVVEYPRSSKVCPDALMGWQSSADTARQIKLRFPTQQAAIAYCEEHKIDFSLAATQKRKLRVKAYADNFAYGRVGSWTH
ncbi:MAG: ETC complex I subunit [Alphaproteobacteria bacterium]|nr:ETC complex I subunit [Alphaproteobacteria bacterium]MBL6777142.1 ETC complex I subunit [Alphaproteobacteria bacterium]